MLDIFILLSTPLIKKNVRKKNAFLCFRVNLAMYQKKKKKSLFDDIEKKEF